VTWGLVLLVIALVGVGTAVAVWWPQSGVGSASRVNATVTKPASCGGQALDEVEIKIGDQTRKAKLDGCGHRAGEQIEVVLPSDTGGDFTVQTAGATPEVAPLSTRLTTLMLCLSGLAGGLYAYLIRRPVPQLRSPVAAV
jgi:hypothetical protein